MKLLAIETATDACSAALMINAEIRTTQIFAPREHARRIMPQCESLLQEAGIGLNQLDCIAFGRGPGSFTGVRIACAVAQGLAFACDLPVAPVSTLAALAQAQAESDDTDADCVLAALDARMGEVYFGAYRRGSDGLVILVGEEQVSAVDTLVLPVEGRWVGAGSGWGVYSNALTERLGRAIVSVNAKRLPEARAVALLGARGYLSGEAVSAEQALPVYLRDKVAEKSKERRPAS